MTKEQWETKQELFKIIKGVADEVVKHSCPAPDTIKFMKKMEEKNRYVNWTVFTFMVSIAIMAIGFVYITANSALQVAQDNRVDIREMQANVQNIASNIVEIKDILKNK